jgi:hypothetical protein
VLGAVAAMRTSLFAARSRAQQWGGSPCHRLTVSVDIRAYFTADSGVFHTFRYRFGGSGDWPQEADQSGQLVNLAAG